MGQNQQSILITGGTRGLGLAIANAFGKTGARLILAYRSDEENAAKTKTAFEQQDIECHTLRIDLSEEGSSEALFAQVRKITPRLAVYVHNAAATAFKPLLEIRPHHIQKTFQITVGSFIQNVQQTVSMMEGGGAIIAVSGMDTREAVPFHGLLASAKASLEMLTAYWAHELAPRNIRVNAVNPGYLETESVRRYFGPLYDRANAFITKMTPAGRPARLEEVASVVQFLASEQSRWVVGQTIVVDGGQTFASSASLLLKP